MQRTSDLFPQTSRIFTVFELTRNIRATLETKFGAVWVQGEIFKLRGRRDALFAGINRQSVVAGDLMDLGSGRCGEADEYDDAITTWIHADSVDVEIGFPVVNQPKVAGLIYVDVGRTHHGDEAWRPA
jgi:hypothetical protein